MLEIVIGLVAYAALYVGAQFLLPGGHFNDSGCSIISDEELAQIRAEKKPNNKKLIKILLKHLQLRLKKITKQILANGLVR